MGPPQARASFMRVRSWLDSRSGDRIGSWLSNISLANEIMAKRGANKRATALRRARNKPILARPGKTRHYGILQILAPARGLASCAFAAGRRRQSGGGGDGE